MKVLFIADNFPPEVNAPASRTFEHCKEWVRLGYEVTVVTCFPNFPQGKLFPGYTNKLIQKEAIDGIKVIRVWSYMSENAGFAKRIVDYLSFAMSALCVGMFQKTDVIVATSPQFFTTFAGYCLSMLKRRPWVFELRDLWPESIISVGAMKRGPATRVLEHIERFMYRKADLIIPVTDAFYEKLKSYGINTEKMHVITNGVDPELFPANCSKDMLKISLGLQKKFVVGYIGTHGMAHNLEFVIETMANVEDPEIQLLCIGDGAKKTAAIQRANELGVSNVTFLEPIPRTEVHKYLSILDAVLVPLRKSETFKNVIPSKIFESAMMQKPILLGVDGQAREIVEHHNAGIYYEPDNMTSLIDALDRVKNNSDLRTTLSKGGKSLATYYNRNRLARNMIDRIAILVSECRG